MRPDRRGVQPRLGVAWRPVAGSSLVVRGGYGVYRNTNVYQSIALLLAQQPPLSKAFSVQNSAANPLTLANGFVAPPATTPNTFAVDPDFRVGYAQNWQASVQKDLPASLTILATYLGHEGQPLDAGVPAEHLSDRARVNPCPACPAGFVYLTSNGRSTATRRSGSAAAPPSQRADGDGAVHVVEGERRCGAFTGVEPDRRRHRAGLAESRGGVRRRRISISGIC